MFPHILATFAAAQIAPKTSWLKTVKWLPGRRGIWEWLARKPKGSRASVSKKWKLLLFYGPASEVTQDPWGHIPLATMESVPPPPIQGTEIRAPVLMETSRHGSGRASGRGGLAAAVLGKLESAAASQREGMV